MHEQDRKGLVVFWLWGQKKFQLSVSRGEDRDALLHLFAIARRLLEHAPVRSSEDLLFAWLPENSFQ